MGSSVPSGCECDGGACGCAAGAASGYGYDGAATGSDTGAAADVRACAGQDDGSADDFSATYNDSERVQRVTKNMTPAAVPRVTPRRAPSDSRLRPCSPHVQRDDAFMI